MGARGGQEGEGMGKGKGTVRGRAGGRRRLEKGHGRVGGMTLLTIQYWQVCPQGRQ